MGSKGFGREAISFPLLLKESGDAFPTVRLDEGRIVPKDVRKLVQFFNLWWGKLIQKRLVPRFLYLFGYLVLEHVVPSVR